MANTQFRPVFFVLLSIFFLIFINSCIPTPEKSIYANRPPIARNYRQANGSGDYLDNIKTIRGLLTHNNEACFIIPCGEMTPAWIIDQTEGRLKQISEAFPRSPNQPLFVEIQAIETPVHLHDLNRDYDQTFVLKSITHASRNEESLGCREKYGKFIFKVHGNEPGWICHITKSGIQFSSINMESPLTFTDVSSVTQDHTSTFQKTNPNHSLTVVVTKEFCRGTMSDEIYGWSGIAVLDGVTYRGCAKQGDQHK